MKLTDLTPAYRAHYLEREDRAGYEAAAPALFEHYYANWADMAKPPVRLTESELATNRQYLLNSLSRIEPALRNFGVQPESLELALIVGQNSTNGHAYREQDRFLPWVAVECYRTQTLADIFVTHELVHALHYQATPAFYFAQRVEKDNGLRQLLTEGVATWLTAEILGVSESLALWADYWPESRVSGWLDQCEVKLPQLARYLLERINSEQSTQLFLLAEPDNILANRSGYYLGLRAVQALARENGLAPAECLTLPRFEAEHLVLDWLHRRIE